MKFPGGMTLVAFVMFGVVAAQAAEKTWAPSNSILEPPVTSLRVDRAEPGNSPAEKALYHARYLDAYTLGVQAYAFGWAPVESYRVCSLMYDPAYRHHAAPNTFRHEPVPADDKYTQFVTPNADLLYSTACLNLKKEPIILHVPNTQGLRYWTAQILDGYTETIANVSNRSVGSGPGDYMLVGPDFKGTLPTGVVRLDMPVNTGFILLRTFFEDKEDMQKRTRVVQQDFTLTPLSAYLSGQLATPEPVPASDPLIVPTEIV